MLGDEGTGQCFQQGALQVLEHRHLRQPVGADFGPVAARAERHAVLLFPQVEVAPARFHQFRVRTGFDQSPAIHHEDAIGTHRPGEAVRHRNHGAPRRHLRQRGVDCSFTGSVQCGGGFVKHQ